MKMWGMKGMGIEVGEVKVRRGIDEVKGTGRKRGGKRRVGEKDEKEEKEEGEERNGEGEGGKGELEEEE